VLKFGDETTCGSSEPACCRSSSEQRVWETEVDVACPCLGEHLGVLFSALLEELC
jgi:hypothetical protein